MKQKSLGTELNCHINSKKQLKMMMMMMSGTLSTPPSTLPPSLRIPNPVETDLATSTAPLQSTCDPLDLETFPKRSMRQRQAPQRLQDYVLY